MQPTIFGVLVIAMGMGLLLWGTLESLMLFVLGMTLLGGSSAITLTALGNSSIMPANLAICFLILRIVLPGRHRTDGLMDAAKANLVLICFVLYGVVGAYILPRIFGNAMYVTPLHPNPTRDPFASEPLKFTNQNITNSVYFLQTMFAALAGYIVARRNMVQVGAGPNTSISALAIAASVIALVHAALGVLSVVAKDQLASAFNFFRNGSYAQLSQEVDEISRMNGIFPEPSNYAGYGFAWLVLVTELWLRDIKPRWTGPAALILGGALLASTASTAYIGLGAYGLVLILRLVLLPGQVPVRKVTLLVGVGLSGVAGIMALAAINPEIGAKLGGLIAGATVEKANSLSALQRGFWARQGIDAFVVSKGLGIGCGSFRSSSLLTAILGCMGVVGIVCFVVYIWRVFMPLRRSTWTCFNDEALAVGAAASWAALMLLVPIAFTAPSPDPGVLWGLFCGLAMGLRGQANHFPTPARSADFSPDLHHNVTHIAERPV